MQLLQNRQKTRTVIIEFFQTNILYNHNHSKFYQAKATYLPTYLTSSRSVRFTPTY